MNRLLILASAFACLVSMAAMSYPSSEYVNNKITQAAIENGVDPLLLKALCQAESSTNLNPSSFNFEDGGPKNHSFGICQVLYSTAKWLGLDDVRCLTNFDTAKELSIDRQEGFILVKMQKRYKNCELFGPLTNARYAAKYLKIQLKEYKDVNLAIAAYNSGTVRRCTDGFVSLKFKHGKTGKIKTVKKRCKVGGLLNQYYVDRVRNNLKKLKSTN